jgi:periplasmic divalent cation tolerance protein
MDAAAVVVLVTAPDAETAAGIGRRLVEERLCACANLLPGLRSLYWWEGAVQDEDEVLMLIKTRPSLVDALTRRVEALHPYDTPEVIALTVTAGSAKYLRWIEDSTAE